MRGRPGARRRALKSMVGWETKRAVRLTRMAGIVRGPSPPRDDLAIQSHDLADALLQVEPMGPQASRGTKRRAVWLIACQGPDGVRQPFLAELSIPARCANDDDAVDAVANGVADARPIERDDGQAHGQRLGEDEALGLRPRGEREQVRPGGQ